MDEDRKIRFLISPLLFFASLAWGLLQDETKNIGNLVPGLDLHFEKISDFLAILAGGGIAVFTLGYVIGTITYVILRFIFWVVGHRGYGSGSHEIDLSDEAFHKIWLRIAAPGEPIRTKMFFAGSTFDHDILRKEYEGVHRWIVRRWNAFSVAGTSFTALILSLVVGVCLRIKFTLGWWIPVAVISVVLFCAAVIAWRDTMGILNFQAMRQQQTNSG